MIIYIYISALFFSFVFPSVLRQVCVIPVVMASASVEYLTFITPVAEYLGERALTEVEVYQSFSSTYTILYTPYSKYSTILGVFLITK